MAHPTYDEPGAYTNGTGDQCCGGGKNRDGDAIRRPAAEQ